MASERKITFDTRFFRDALGSFATGVTIVTTTDGGGNPIGLTANSFNSVSLEPPIVLWSLMNTSKSMKLFTDKKKFAVHILGADQINLSNKFASRETDKFEGVNWSMSEFGLPIIEGCSAVFQCKTMLEQEAGDHVTFFGEVVECVNDTNAPLIWHNGGYLSLPG